MDKKGNLRCCMRTTIIRFITSSHVILSYSKHVEFFCYLCVIILHIDTGRHFSCERVLPLLLLTCSITVILYIC